MDFYIHCPGYILPYIQVRIEGIIKILILTFFSTCYDSYRLFTEPVAFGNNDITALTL